MFFMRQFFQSLPRELEEAAYIDGAGIFRTFWSVVLPLSKGPIITLGIITFLTSWNDFLWPLLILGGDRQDLTLPVGLATLQGQYTFDYGKLMAGALVLTIPVLILYALLPALYHPFHFHDRDQGLNETFATREYSYPALDNRTSAFERLCLYSHRYAIANGDDSTYRRACSYRNRESQPTVTAEPTELSGPSYTNPVYNSDFPDPHVILVDDTYYAYSTVVSPSNIQVISSKDSGQLGRPG